MQRQVFIVNSGIFSRPLPAYGAIRDFGAEAGILWFQKQQRGN
jgi:hypothetical protein